MIRDIKRADGSVRWEVYVTTSGVKRYVGGYESEREAKRAEEEERVIQRKIADGRLPPRVDSKRTFREAIKVWLDTLEKNPGMKGARSRDDYEQSIDNHAMKRFGDVPIVEIRKADVLDWRDNLIGVSSATINKLVGTLSSAFSFFVGRDWVPSNPCRGVKMLEKRPKVFPWLQSSEQITKLLAECTPNIQTLVAVLVGTGMRLDEALHLKWDDVDIEHRLITVHRGSSGTTKSGKARRVPIFDSVLAVLKTMKLARGKEALLWAGGKAGKTRSQNAVWKPFKRAAELAGLPPALRVHDLRHTFASLFLIDGGDIFKLSRILGHSSVAITERTYAHLKPTAYAEDYGRVAFRMPSESNVVAYSAA